MTRAHVWGRPTLVQPGPSRRKRQRYGNFRLQQSFFIFVPWYSRMVTFTTAVPLSARHV